MGIRTREIFDWLDSWQRLINTEQYEAARPLFSNEVVAFGTVTGFMKSLKDLESRQWRQVWHRIKDFHFDKEEAFIFSDENSNLATVVCLWSSLGRIGNGYYQRKGRVTLVLQKTEQKVLCLHSHFSMEPGLPALGD